MIDHFKDHPKKDIVALLMKTTPIGDRVVIVPDEKETVSKNMIARSQSQRGEDELLMGTVVAVGRGYTTDAGVFIPTTLKVGDRVLLARFNGSTIRVDRKGKIHHQSADITEDRLPVRIVRQDGVEWAFPSDWPV